MAAVYQTLRQGTPEMTVMGVSLASQVATFDQPPLAADAFRVDVEP